MDIDPPTLVEPLKELVFDTPRQPIQRYQVERQGSRHHIWRFNQKCRGLPAGQWLRIELRRAALVHWSDDGWVTTHDTPTRDSGMGLHVADLETTTLRPGREIILTFHWLQIDRWEGTDYTVTVIPAPPSTAAGM